MIKNYLILSLRNALRQKNFTLLSVLGLSIGITCFLLILLPILFENSYNDFYQNNDRIYRVTLERRYPDRVKMWKVISPKAAETLVHDYPEILNSVRMTIAESAQKEIIIDGKTKFNNHIIAAADTNFFNLFSIPLLRGNPKNVLNDPRSIVLTEKTAELYFGKGVDPIGKKIGLGKYQIFNVTGVSANVPINSTIQFDMLYSMKATGFYYHPKHASGFNVYTYILLDKRANAEEVEIKIQSMIERYFKSEIEKDNQTFREYLAAGNNYKFFLEALEDIHLKHDGDIKVFYLFIAIAIIVILMACINFTNLVTARSINRAKEVGVRKTYGAFRGQLIMQFLVESILLCFVSLIIALISVECILPYFNLFLEHDFSIDYFGNFYVIPFLIVFSVILGLISGIYPAFVLSKFSPVNALKDAKIKGTASNRLRNILVICQFSASLILIIITLNVKSQLEFIKNKDLGFDKNNVLIISDAKYLTSNIKNFKEVLLKNPKITSVAGSFTYPGSSNSSWPFGNVADPSGAKVSFYELMADCDLFNTLGIKIRDGEIFKFGRDSDSNAVIINETAVRALHLKNPVGANLIRQFSADKTTLRVIGVVKDFNVESLHAEITPIIFYGFAANSSNASYISVKLNPDGLQSSIENIKKTWNSFTGNKPFSYSFLDEDLSKWYKKDKELEITTGFFSFIAIILSCIGLLGLAANNAKNRTKEIGIRKVFGASSTNIMSNLSKEFVKLLSISFVISIPIAYYISDNILSQYAYFIDQNLWIYLIALSILLIISLLTISVQTIKAAITNPVNSLRDE